MVFLLILLGSLQATGQHNYYFSVAGDDAHDGSRQAPFRSIARLNQLKLTAGDTVFLKGGDTFKGKIEFADLSGSAVHPIVFTSFGSGRATIDGGAAEAASFRNCRHVHLLALAFRGDGRKTGNTTSGVELIQCAGILASHLTVSGFQKAGLLFYETEFSTADSVRAHNNGAVGISVDGTYQKRNSKNITIKNCLADNNPGDPTNLTNHSGNGILVGNCKNVVIEYSTATNNGWDMPRVGNGPVGIWAYEADSVIIQHCLSYKNKTAKGAKDGGGFDLDGGVKNSVIQYCLSYENQGSGYGIFQYAGASQWDNNILRFCVSIDDGNVTEGASGMLLWNDKGNPASIFTRFYAYHNIFYNRSNSAFGFDPDSEHEGFYFVNNIFISGEEKEIFYGNNKNSHDVFLGNFWSQANGGFLQDGQVDFSTWAENRNYERLDNKMVGTTSKKPVRGIPEHPDVTTADRIRDIALMPLSKFPFKGIDLLKTLRIDPGPVDYFGNPVAGRQAVPGVQYRK